MQKFPQRFSADRIDELGRYFNQWGQNELTVGQTGVGYGQTWIVNHCVTVKDDIDVQRSWTLHFFTDTQVFSLHFQAYTKQVMRLKLRFGFDCGVEEPGLIEDLSRLRGIDGRPANDLDPAAGKTQDAGAQVLFSITEVRTQRQEYRLHPLTL
jgi:hypothetical protein